MGHLSHLKEEYRALVERLDAGPVGYPEPRDARAREGWKEILTILFTPEEAELASRMPMRPMELGQLAERLAVSVQDLKPRLDAMCDKGLIMDIVGAESGRTYYLLSPPVVGFFEFSMMRANDKLIPQKRLAQAMAAYLHGDDTFAREIFGEETMIGRALVHETALEKASPEVLDWERATSIVRQAKTAAVSLCYCRHKNEHLGAACETPKENCLSLGAGADFVARRGFGRRIDLSQALEILAAARESGLVQIADNVKDRPFYICNCCGCCCGQLQAINQFGLPAVTPSGFVAGCDGGKCVGCARCARACPIAAIAMAPVHQPAALKNRMRASVNEDKCIGCGVCADTCNKDAMRMRRRDHPPRVPSNTVERVLRTAIEKRRLLELLIDAGESRGRRFLLRLLQAICELPLAQRVLAAEQLRSRFLRAALAVVKDPTQL